MDATVILGALTTELLELSNELRGLPSLPLVGGGLGLYLKQRLLEERTDAATVVPAELWPPARATEDVDLFLPTEVLVSAEHMRTIRVALDRLGYAPVVDFVQFVKQTPSGPVKVDLLTCAVPPQYADRVQVKAMRVRPTGDVQLHAYLTREALALGLAPYEFRVSGTRSDGRAAELTVRLPNAFTYLLMKLHAFRDRVQDARKNLASHHALDIYRLVAMATRDEYDLVRELARVHRESEPVAAVRDIVRGSFGADHHVGLLRLRAGARDSGMSWSDVKWEELVAVLAECFLPAHAGE